MLRIDYYLYFVEYKIKEYLMLKYLCKNDSTICLYLLNKINPFNNFDYIRTYSYYERTPIAPCTW